MAGLAASGTMERSALKPTFRMRLVSLLLLASCTLLAFDDIGIGGLSGGPISSPAWVGFLAAWGLLPRHQRRFWNRKFWLGVLALGLIVTLMNLIPLLGLAAPLPYDRTVKLLTTTTIWLALAGVAPALFRALPHAFRMGMILSFVVMAVTGFADQAGAFNLDSIAFLHETANAQQRARGTRFEASSLGAGLLVVLGIIAIGMSRGVVIGFMTLALPVVLLSTESRGADAACIAIAVVVVIVAAVPSRQLGWLVWKASLVTSLCAIVLSLQLDALLQSRLWNSFADLAGTSDATRAVWAQASVRSILEFPFGMGYGSYVYHLPRLLFESVVSVQADYSVLQLNEVLGLAASGGAYALSPKVLPGIIAVYLGVPGLLLLWALLRRLLLTAGRDSTFGSSGSLIAVSCLIIVSFTFYSSVSAWEQAIAVGILLALDRTD